MQTRSLARPGIRRGAAGAAALLFLSAAAIVSTPGALACTGNTRPVCSMSTVLAKAVPAVFVLPPSGPITVPVPVTVFVSAAGACPGPLSTTISLAATCTPPPSGTGTVTIPTPGLGAYTTVVPITFPAGPARICTVVGTATTTWASGAVTVGTGDTVICLVEPAPNDPSVPRLDLELLTPEIETAHPGDQRHYRYRLTNNDPDHAVTLTLSSDSEQVARQSGGGGNPPGSGIGPVALADPGTGDNFPIAFLIDLYPDPGPGNNYLFDDGTQENEIGLNHDGSLIWLNQFEVLPGQEIIDKVSVAYGPGADGKRAQVLIYDDPDNDGDPGDAVLLQRADTVIANGDTGIFDEVKILPTPVGSAGDSFFVGVVVQEADAFTFPAALDEASDPGRSWVAGDGGVCEADIEDLNNNPLPPTLIGDVGFPGSWMLRAHGVSEAPLGWVPLPPDPTSFGIPIISRDLRLCPGESRIVEIASRSWPMCRSGSCSEQRVILDGVYDNGDDAFACAGAVLLVDTIVPPDYQCPDGGMYAIPQVKPDVNGIELFAHMPSHDIVECVEMPFVEIITQDGPPILPGGPLPPAVLNQDLGRLSFLSVGSDGPAIQVDQPFQVILVTSMFSVNPEVMTEVIELHLHGAPPNVEPDHGTVIARTKATGPNIFVDSFFDVFFTVQVDGITGGLHHVAHISPTSINAQILGPDLVEITFNAVFPFDPQLPPQIDEIHVNLDTGGDAFGLEVGAPPCPGDVDGDGDVDQADLGALLAAYNTTAGDPDYNPNADFDNDGDVDQSDLGTLLGNFNTNCD
ncbi:MAG: hypothetical protein ACF8NJ_05760 [Phycisphaerales bacterium JB038]